MTHRNGRKKDNERESEPRNMWRLGETIFWNEAEYQAELRRRADELFTRLAAEAHSLEMPPPATPRRDQDATTIEPPLPQTDGLPSVLPASGGSDGKPSAWETERGNDSAASAESPANRFEVMTAAQLGAGQYRKRELIPGLLVAGQPGGIFGAFKTLKTSIAADLLISLASGTPFLGRFAVPEPGRVLFLSGESGLDALQSIARRICAERGLTLESLDNFLLLPRVPKLDQAADLKGLKELIEREKPVCVVIDPAYLAMGTDKTRNLFAMGALLYPLTELCESTGCTILLVHHCKRSGKHGEPATLDDIAWSGFAEFSAQWLLLSRRKPFDPGTGHHELWLSAGSRRGHHGLWEVDVEEGSLANEEAIDASPSSMEETRLWKTSVERIASARVRVDEQFVEASEDRRLRRRGLTFKRQCQRVLEYLAAHPDGASARTIRESLGLSGGRIAWILDRLMEQGEVKQRTSRHERPFRVTYHRVTPMDLSSGSSAPAADPKVFDPGTGQFVDQPKEPARLLAVPTRMDAEDESTLIAWPDQPHGNPAAAGVGQVGRDTFSESEKVSQGENVSQSARNGTAPPPTGPRGPAGRSGTGGTGHIR